jgi:hypothetical protein
MRPTNNRGWGGQNVGGWANSGSRGSGGGFPSNVRVIRRKFGSDYGYGKKKTTTATTSPTKKTEETTTATAATELDESTKAYLVSLNETGQEKNLVVNTVDKTSKNGGGKKKGGKGKGRQSRRRRRRGQ